MLLWHASGLLATHPVPHVLHGQSPNLVGSGLVGRRDLLWCMLRALRSSGIFIQCGGHHNWSVGWLYDDIPAPPERTATYTIESKTNATVSGTAPDGSSATYAQTANNVGQITSNNTFKLTLKGYEGATITGLALSMKSNGKAGAGSLSVTCGDAVIASIADAKFNSTTPTDTGEFPVIVSAVSGEETIASTTVTLTVTGEPPVHVPAAIKEMVFDSESGTVLLRFEGDGAAVYGTTDLNGEWVPVEGAVIEGDLATVPMTVPSTFIRVQ